jgi:hypothetical protein
LILIQLISKMRFKGKQSIDFVGLDFVFCNYHNIVTVAMDLHQIK